MTAKQDVEALIKRLNDSERLYDEEVRVTELHHLLTDAAALLRSQADALASSQAEVEAVRVGFRVCLGAWLEDADPRELQSNVEQFKALCNWDAALKEPPL